MEILGGNGFSNFVRKLLESFHKYPKKLTAITPFKISYDLIFLTIYGFNTPEWFLVSSSIFPCNIS